VPIIVVKKDKSRQVFDRQKLFNGMIKACEKRPVTSETIERAVSDIETHLQNSLDREVTSIQIGELAMEKLKKQQEYEMAQLDKQLENEKSLLAYQKSLSSSGTKITGSSGGSYSGSKGTYTGTREKAASNMTPIAHQTKTQSKNYPIDMQSVLALGYGPISTSYLNQLVESGKVEEYVEGGKTKFRKVVKMPSLR
jgi:hypothetical protein